MDRIYLDNNATTPLIPEVWEAMLPWLRDSFGNPASAHQEGRRARKATEDAREQIADLLQAPPDGVIFTSGATEANNLAIHGLTAQGRGQLISSRIEHPCIVQPLEQLSKEDYFVTWLPVNPHGIITPEALGEAITDQTQLITVMLANHETGAIQPIDKLVALSPDRAVFHCDAAQAVGKIPVRFNDTGLTSISLSGHKLHGPKGIGALLVRSGQKIEPLLRGGHQQQSRRPGTESPALAVGLAKAIEMACRNMANRNTTMQALQQRFLAILQEQATPVEINGPKDLSQRMCTTLNLSFPGASSESMLMNLDLAGVACSTGSACSSGSLLPSPVLQAMGIPEDALKSALRFSFSSLLTLEEVEDAAYRIAKAATRLRDHSTDLE